MSRFIVGVMGGGETAAAEHCKMAYHLGKLIAQKNWVLLNGGRPAGVMEASARGAKDNGGLTIGILPDRDSRFSSEYIDIAIATGMGDGRNYINILSSHVIVALPGRAGTISEIALALKNNKNVILLGFDTGSLFNIYQQSGLLHPVSTPEEAICVIDNIRKKQ
ncbi:TIGR00725 family protein [Desulfolucanica intricata]|uniref:TIGR00725 family protein n=1 Tax=Desulfolucanica intricata TaxID=1285191 RepID=UPI00082C9C34|nr:TIGR00725 family protein [Desulfolucanica intricata]